MSWRDAFKRVFGASSEPETYTLKEMTTGFLGETIEINVPDALYIKELAVYSAVSLIANAISQCEIIVYENGKRVKNGDWYSLNVQANVNETASQFWHKVVERMLKAGSKKGAFVIIKDGNLYCADQYNIKEKRPFKMTGNLYDGVVVDDLVLNREYAGRNIMIFKLEQSQANQLIDNMYADLSGLVSAAVNRYKNANIQRWKFKVNSREAGTEDFQKAWQGKLKAAVQRYVNGDAQVYVEYDDKTLDPVLLSTTGTTVNSDDSIKLINQIFELVARTYHIPPGLMTAGNYNISDVVNQFLTFAVDPIADMIGKTITAAYGKEKFEQGCYFRVDTSKIRHFDVFGMASDVDKLISSGFASVNEVRQAAEWDAAGDPDDPDSWLNQHILTKNYELGGDKSEKTNVQLPVPADG